jgi:hypothetical protein
MNAPAPATPASAAMRRFVCTHVRQALQHVVAVGAISPYLLAAWTRRPFQTVCIHRRVHGY